MINSSSDRIAQHLRDWIAQASVGAKLPSTRSLVAQFAVSPVTVQRALAVLSAQGLTEARPGVGVYVRGVRRAKPHDFGWQTAALGIRSANASRVSAALRSVPNDTISLHAGYPDRELLPERLVRAALVRASRTDAVVSRPPVAGLPELQAWFATELAGSVPNGYSAPSAKDVLVLPGSQSGLNTVFRSLVGAGNAMLIESPSYWGAILAAAQVGVQLVPVPSGPDGPDPEQIDLAFERSGARAFYAQPNFANPTGVRWSAERAERILEVVRSRGAFLIEDDWAHDFGIEAESCPIAARDDTGHVVYLRSLTKSVSPAVRVAGIIARGPARDRMLADVQAESMYVSGLLQAAALDVVTQPAWRTHLRELRRALASRRNLLAEALRVHASAMHLEKLPKGGLNLWARLPEEIDLPAFVRACEMEGLIVAAGDEWFPAEPTGRFLRLNYSGPNPGAFEEGAQILGRLLER